MKMKTWKNQFKTTDGTITEWTDGTFTQYVGLFDLVGKEITPIEAKTLVLENIGTSFYLQGKTVIKSELNSDGYAVETPMGWQHTIESAIEATWESLDVQDELKAANA